MNVETTVLVHPLKIFGSQFAYTPSLRSDAKINIYRETFGMSPSDSPANAQNLARDCSLKNRSSFWPPEIFRSQFVPRSVRCF